ncbi:hypothetical protein [Desulfovermiculus halophilus]|uniref:hypothetical protein n=1 Tax=Desulfovermiculus halophilus TaxID=339722 RepID=UPI00048389F1|nr:hypothetical protein [Desulfovermiculus halophilus]
MADQFKQALKDITDICKFEHWLRFTYMTKEGEEHKLSIPESDIAEMKRDLPLLAGLAEDMNNEIMTPDTSQQKLIAYIQNRLDGDRYDITRILSVLNSKSFQVEMQAFHMWVEAHEDQLETSLMNFTQWMQLFEAWKRTGKGQDVLQTLSSPQDDSSQTTH